MAESLPRNLNSVLADAFLLSKADREALEYFMRAARTQNLEMDADSVRGTDSATLRGMWGLA